MSPTEPHPEEPAAVEVASSYRCPLCTCCRASETLFVANAVAGTKICEGCSIELSHFLEFEERPSDPVVDALETVTGLSFAACRLRYYREAIGFLEAKLLADRVDREVSFEIVHTGRSREDTIAHWRRVIDDYKATLARLEAGGGEQ